MSATEYRVIYVTNTNSEASPYISFSERPAGVSTARAGGITKGELPNTVGSPLVVWVVEHGTAAHEYLKEHAAGRLATFLNNPKEWLRAVAVDPKRHSAPAEWFRPAVKAFGLESTENGKKDFKIDNNVVGTPSKVDLWAKSVIDRINAADKGIESVKPHTTVITQVDIPDRVDPIGDTLHEVLQLAGLEDVDPDDFPKDGNISIQWSQVTGRDRLRKFTFTVDYSQESN